MRFDPEQLYFFKLVLVMFYVKELLQLWKGKLWDPSKAFPYLNCAEFHRGKSPTGNDKERELCDHGTSKSCQEQKHTDLYEASLKEEINDESFQELPIEAPPNGIRHDHVQCRLRNLAEMKVASAEDQFHLLRNKGCFEAKAEMIEEDTLEEKVNDDKSLQELPVKAPPNGIRHHHVQCRSRNLAEKKVALAEDQFHLLRKKVCVEVKAEVVEKDTFDTLIEKTKHTFNVLEQDTSRIDEIVEMGEEDFPAGKVLLLRKKLEEERSCAKQFQKDNSNEIKSEDDSSDSQCANEEWPNKAMLSFSSEASSLNSVPSLSASEEAAGELTENTYQEDYASSRPLSDSSAELQADFYEMSSYEEGLLSKENHLDTESVAVKDSLEQRDQEFKQRRQPNCICARHQSNDIVAKQLQVKIEDLLHKLDQLQAENIFYVDRCLKQEEEITRLKENLTQIEEEKQGLESEVGRQLFLEGKNKRHSKLYQPFTEHCGEQIMPNTASGASFDVTGLDGEQLDIAGPCDNSGLLQFLIQEILLSNSELSRIKVLVRPKVDSERLASIRKGSELFKELECRGELSCSYVKCLLEKIDRSDLAEKLVAYNRDGLFKRDDYSPQEGNQWCKASELICGVDNRTSNEVEESRKIFNGADIDEEVHDGNHSSTSSSSCHSNDSNDFVDIYKADSPSGRCGFASSCSQSSSSSAVNMQSLTKDSHCGASTIKLNPDHHALKTWKNSGESAFDITNGEEKQGRSVSLLLTDGCFESEEEKRRGASKEEGGKDGCGNSTSICDGAVNASYLIQHCNTVDVVDGPGCTSSRAPDSLKLKNISDVSHVSLPPEGMPQKQNVSSATATAQKSAVLVQPDSCTSNQSNTWEHAGARPKNTTQKQNFSHVKITAKKESAIDQSDSYTSYESIESKHLGARPRDRTQKGDRSLDSSSLFSSLVDLVPQQVGEPVVQGVINAFLARHSEDKHLHESLYYNNAEEMLAKDMDSMMNMIDSNQAKPYLGDCQAAAMSDSYYQPYSSAFPLPSEAYIGEDGFPLDYTFNGNSVLPPGPSSSYIGASMSQNSYFNSFNPNIGSDSALDTSEPQLLQNGHLTSLQRSDFLQSGFTSAGLTSDFLGTTGPQMTHSVIGTQSNISFTGSTSILPPEPLQLQTPSTTNVGLLASSAGSTPIYGNQANASTGLPTSSSVARTNGSNSRLLSGLESGRNTHLSPVSSIRDGVNTSGHRNSSSILNTIGDHLASGTYREGNSAGDSSSSCLTSTANTGGDHDQSSAQSGGSVSNENYGTESVESTDNSLLELEQRVEEACAMVERVLREREEREEFGREIERKEREIRAERARKKREREARELEEARGWPQQQEPVTGQSLWLCEHYQRHCRVRFPCCNNFYSCHRCHNNSKECENEEAKASHATHLKCSYCHHEQEIAEDSAKCRSCGAKMSAYFCGICKHFTSIDKNPYHCDKCGICRIHKDKSFHCDVCNVCLDKRLQGKHKCRPDSGHDECCICLEDAFSGCQILPCSHKVHRECAIAMIQNGIRTCPVCRHPLYSPAPE